MKAESKTNPKISEPDPIPAEELAEKKGKAKDISTRTKTETWQGARASTVTKPRPEPVVGEGETEEFRNKQILCYRCQKEGHTARYCRAKEPQLRPDKDRSSWGGKSKASQVVAAEYDEDDPITGAVFVDGVEKSLWSDSEEQIYYCRYTQEVESLGEDETIASKDKEVANACCHHVGCGDEA